MKTVYLIEILYITICCVGLLLLDYAIDHFKNKDNE